MSEMDYEIGHYPYFHDGVRRRVFNTSWTDLAGMVASLGCAIHCAVMPFVISYLASFGLTWMAGESFHQWMAVICAVIALMAFVPGWRRHRQMIPMLMGIVGISLLSYSAFATESCCEIHASNQEISLHGALTNSSCHACNIGTVETPSQTEKSESWNRQLRPYVTPFGGFVLVVAHLVNHGFGCRCCSVDQHCQSVVTKD